MQESDEVKIQKISDMLDRFEGVLQHFKTMYQMLEIFRISEANDPESIDLIPEIMREFLKYDNYKELLFENIEVIGTAFKAIVAFDIALRQVLGKKLIVVTHDKEGIEMLINTMLNPNT